MPRTLEDIGPRSTTIFRHSAGRADLPATFDLTLTQDLSSFGLTVNAKCQGGYIDKPLLDRRDGNRTNILGGRTSTCFVLGDNWLLDLVAIGQVTNGGNCQ